MSRRIGRPMGYPTWTPGTIHPPYEDEEPLIVPEEEPFVIPYVLPKDDPIPVDIPPRKVERKPSIRQ